MKHTTMNSNQVIFGSQNELRGVQLFRAISRRLGSKHRRYDYEEDSTDSERSSSGSSTTSCSESTRSSDSLRKVFQSLSLNTRSSSDSKHEQPKRILRQPVSYTYVRGLSGLPTIRVPRNSTCCPQAR